ncbi:MAG: DUF4918 family protein [Actinomyces sp.]|jgi:hypothetical protein|nr:uracil-DNA glycosylase family protein [Actinomyces sp.]MCI1662495.1 DUF4918 family protein [Actinomyces sp.]MCI1691728.1 DUF4918 family protein [Actinomyces sp.]
MAEMVTVADQILRFYQRLAATSLKLPPGFAVVNPFNGPRRPDVLATVSAFYKEYYDDYRPRRLVLGSSPARRGTGVTGVPFEDAGFLKAMVGNTVEGFGINKSSSEFLFDIIGRYGGRSKFYADFCMSFVCPLGLARLNSRGSEVNCNYYETAELRRCVRSFIVESLKSQVQFGVDDSVCYCIGSGENFKYLAQLNEAEHFFDTIIPLEHPRFITQYNPGRRDAFVAKYLYALRGGAR